MTMKFDEINLISIYKRDTRIETIEAIRDMMQYLTPEEDKLKALSESSIKTLEEMSDTDFDNLELFPDFDM